MPATRFNASWSTIPGLSKLSGNPGNSRKYGEMSRADPELKRRDHAERAAPAKDLNTRRMSCSEPRHSAATRATPVITASWISMRSALAISAPAVRLVHQHVRGQGAQPEEAEEAADRMSVFEWIVEAEQARGQKDGEHEHADQAGEVGGRPDGPDHRVRREHHDREREQCSMSTACDRGESRPVDGRTGPGGGLLHQATLELSSRPHRPVASEGPADGAMASASPAPAAKAAYVAAPSATGPVAASRRRSRVGAEGPGRGVTEIDDGRRLRLAEVGAPEHANEVAAPARDRDYDRRKSMISTSEGSKCRSTHRSSATRSGKACTVLAAGG